jgi:hypothetical protein
MVLNYTQSVGPLSLGKHIVAVTVRSYTLYKPTSSDFDVRTYNMYSHEPWEFIVSVPSPTSSPAPTLTPTPPPSPSPSPSPTIEPSLEPTQTPIPTSDSNQTLDLMPILALSGIVVIAVALGALVIFRRRR